MTVVGFSKIINRFNGLTSFSSGSTVGPDLQKFFASPRSLPTGAGRSVFLVPDQKSFSSLPASDQTHRDGGFDLCPSQGEEVKGGEIGMKAVLKDQHLPPPPPPAWTIIIPEGWRTDWKLMGKKGAYQLFSNFLSVNEELSESQSKGMQRPPHCCHWI